MSVVSQVMNRSRQFLSRLLLTTWLLLVWLPGPEVLAASPGGTPVDESYTARVWQADDGLPENRVVGVVQSADGYLWVATQGGLVRFDGVRFQRVDLAGAGAAAARCWTAP